MFKKLFCILFCWCPWRDWWFPCCKKSPIPFPAPPIPQPPKLNRLSYRTERKQGGYNLVTVIWDTKFEAIHFSYIGTVNGKKKISSSFSLHKDTFSTSWRVPRHYRIEATVKFKDGVNETIQFEVE